MKTILVLIDFSIRAEFAAEFAMHMAMKNGANILLCSAMEPKGSKAKTIDATWPDLAKDVMRNEMLFDLTELGKRLANLTPHENELFTPNINYITEFGSIEEVVEKIVEDKSINLVVMGSHKSYGITRFFYGSHTHTVLDKLNCPVLLIPESLQFHGINSIAYATDLTFDNDKVINFLVDFASPFHATIAVNHISPLSSSSPDPATVHLQNHLDSFNPPIFYNSVKASNIKDSLLEMTGTGRADILTLVHKRYDLFDRFFKPSMSKQIANIAKVPLLVLPNSYGMAEKPKFDQSNYEPVTVS